MKTAWALAALSVVATVAATTIAIANGDPVADVVAGVGTVFSLCFPVMGALVVSRRGHHAVGWLMIFIGASLALQTFAYAWASVALIWSPGALPGGELAAWVGQWLWLPSWALATTLLPVLLPDGRPTGRRRLLARLDIGVVAAFTVALAIVSWPLRGFVEVPQHPPAEVAADVDRLLLVFWPGAAAVVALTVASLGNLIVRYRQARDRQIAWVLYGAALAVVFSIVSGFPGRASAADPRVAQPRRRPRGGDVPLRPLRHRRRRQPHAGLRRRDRDPRAAYLVSVLALQWLLSPSSDLSIAGSTLAVAALFGPRGRVQAFVDRRFYRRKYDAQRTLDAFSARLRNEVALDAMEAELRAVVADTVQPKSVFLWVRQ